MLWPRPERYQRLNRLRAAESVSIVALTPRVASRSVVSMYRILRGRRYPQRCLAGAGSWKDFLHGPGQKRRSRPAHTSKDSDPVRCVGPHGRKNGPARNGAIALDAETRIRKSDFARMYRGAANSARSLLPGYQGTGKWDWQSQGQRDIEIRLELAVLASALGRWFARILDRALDASECLLRRKPVNNRTPAVFGVDENANGFRQDKARTLFAYVFQIKRSAFAPAACRKSL